MCQTFKVVGFMKNKSFKFKQFEVFHDKCAMKVGTDGVLLGAWAQVDNCESILDVGTGTGLISLMLSQRNNAAYITAIEIDELASVQATENVKRSSFADKINVQHTSYQNFAHNNSFKYDAIVSNPPFFINSLQPVNMSRSNARHTDSLSLSDLLSLSKLVLNDNGHLSFIYPSDEILDIEEFITAQGWHIHRRTEVYSKSDSDKPKRVLFELGLTASDDELIQDSLVIEIDRHVYSEEYVNLTKSFYLKM